MLHNLHHQHDDVEDEDGGWGVKFSLKTFQAAVILRSMTIMVRAMMAMMEMSLIRL